MTRQIHDRMCDRCASKVPKDKCRFVIGPAGVAEVTEQQTVPTAMDLCTPCEKSALKWWQRPRGVS